MLAQAENQSMTNEQDVAANVGGSDEGDGAAAVEAPPKRRGRQKKDPPVFIAPIAEGKVEHLPLAALNLDNDQTYMFRALLRVGDLAASIQAQGQQIPIIVRPHPTRDGYQIISGFRRATAIKEIGWTTVAAIVRELDDESAFRASVLENTARKTYSDIDRAYVFKAYKDRDYKSGDIGAMMGLTERQVNNLLSLLELPKTVQDALSDTDAAFKATHALFLRKMKRKYPKLDYGRWIRATNDEELSVAQLTRQINEAYRAVDPPAFSGLLNPKSSKLEEGLVHFKPVKIQISSLAAAERAALKEELSRILAQLN